MKIFILIIFTIFLHASQESYLLGLKAYYDNNRSNNTQAITLLSQTAKKGKNADAAFLLGVAYSEGNLIPKDLKKALEWYELAATLGDKDAMLATGWLYYKGEAIVQNLSKAKYWFQKAADLGDQDALQMAQYIEELMASSF